VFILNAINLTDFYVGLDVPKVFFYGSYKVRIYFTDTHGKIQGCVVFVIDIKRPWE